MSVAPGWVTPGWLGLREPADAAARSTLLVEHLRARMPRGPHVVHDLGCGSGSMTRWLAPRLDGPQHWIMHDQDPGLLDAAVALTDRVAAADLSPVTVQSKAGDITHLGASDFANASLVTASALLDILTEQELARVVDACVVEGCPTLFTLTVVGRVVLDPPHPLDLAIASAFNAHQQRPVRNGRLLGPAALTVARRLFLDAGAQVLLASSPWRLGPGDAELTTAWLNGWVDAAAEMRPDLRPAVPAYVRRRVTEAASGRLRVTLHHGDLLAMPPAVARR